MSYVCPNGHPVELVLMVACEDCMAYVSYEPVAHGAELFERIAELERALGELVRLKDGPRDDAYRAAKDAAWETARELVA